MRSLKIPMRPLSLLLLVAALTTPTLHGQAPAAGQSPAVIRTMTHHQITSLPQGGAGYVPVLSENGKRAAFLVNPSDSGPHHVAVADFDGSNYHDLDAFNADWVDLSADGGRVIYGTRGELHIVNADGSGKRTLLKLSDPYMFSVRICGDASRIFFLLTRDVSRVDGSAPQPMTNGVYSIAPDGTDLKRIVSREDVARLRGIQPADLGYNFSSYGPPDCELDVSYHGNAVVFGVHAKEVDVLLGCGRDGGGLHTILATTPATPGGASPNTLTSLAISSDGNTVGYHLALPDELGAVAFDGSARRVLLNDPHFGWGGNTPIYLSSDGARLAYVNCQFNTDKSGYFELMHSVAGKILAYVKASPSMDAQGRRFVYWTDRSGGALQLATMEVDVPLNQLRGAPQIANLSVQPPAILRNKGNVAATKLTASVQSQPTLGDVTSDGFTNGVFDQLITTTYLHEEKPGAGVFSSQSLYADASAPDGPRTLRVDAQDEDSAKLWHGYVVEIGPFPVSDGPPSGPTVVSVDGTPPAPPSVTPGSEASGPPLPPTTPGGDGGTSTASTSTASTGSGGPSTGTGATGIAGSGTGTSTTGTGGTDTGTTATGPIDLTGFWSDNNGAVYDIRQIGSAVFWSMDNRPTVINVFQGTISGATLAGNWEDLPGGRFFNTGALSLRIESKDRMVKLSDSIPYGGTTWTRLGSAPGAVAGGGGGPGLGGGGGPGLGGGLGGGGKGGGSLPATPTDICSDPRTLPAMDEWLASAIPPQKPGDSLHYEAWGRLVGRTATSALTVSGPPTTPLSRCQWLWQYAAQLNSVNLGTLKDYVLKKLATTPAPR